MPPQCLRCRYLFGRRDAESKPERINKSSCSAIKGLALSNAFLSESNNLTFQPARENTIAQLIRWDHFRWSQIELSGLWSHHQRAFIVTLIQHHVRTFSISDAASAISASIAIRAPTPSLDSRASHARKWCIIEFDRQNCSKKVSRTCGPECSQRFSIILIM